MSGKKWANLGQNGPFQRKHQITVKQVPLYALLCKPPPASTFPAPASTGVLMAGPQGVTAGVASSHGEAEPHSSSEAWDG